MAAARRWWKRKASRGHWNARSAVFDRRRNPGRRSQRVGARVEWLQAKGPSGGHVLDLGCGTGDHSLALAASGFRATGLDFSGAMVARARAKAAGREAVVRFVQADFNEPLPFADGEFDHVLSAWALHYARRPAAVLAEVRRVMKPGGRALIIALHSQPPGRPLAFQLWRLAGRDRGVHRFGDGELEALMVGAGLQVVDRDDSDRRVVQVIARAV